MMATADTRAETHEDGPSDAAETSAVFLDFDTVMLATFQGRRGLELRLQSDLDAALDRLQEVADKIVVLVDPPPPESGHALDTERRLEVLREGLGELVDGLIVVTCPVRGEAKQDCGRPGSGLIELAIEQNAISRRDSWHIGGDQEGVVAARGAGLRTIRIGPNAEDHLSNVHRADYEARDLLDAANRILLEEVSAPQTAS